jgi:hypothetical protein
MPHDEPHLVDDIRFRLCECRCSDCLDRKTGLCVCSDCQHQTEEL